MSYANPFKALDNPSHVHRVVAGYTPYSPVNVFPLTEASNVKPASRKLGASTVTVAGVVRWMRSFYANDLFERSFVLRYTRIFCRLLIFTQWFSTHSLVRFLDANPESVKTHQQRHSR
jgi:hypothetical protein